MTEEIKIYKSGLTKEINMDIFKIDSPNKFYLLGALASDGNIAKNGPTRQGAKISLSSKDKDWLEIINKLVSNQNLISNPKNNCSEINIYRKELYDICYHYDITEKKSLTIKFSDKIPEQYYPDFIRGCIDGDGSISHLLYNKTKKKTGKIYQYIKSGVYLCGASKDFLLSVRDITDKLDITSSFYVNNKAGDSNHLSDGRIITASVDNYRVSYSDPSAYKFLNWIYYPGHELSMPRKRAKAQDVIDYWSIKLSK